MAASRRIIWNIRAPCGAACPDVAPRLAFGPLEREFVLGERPSLRQADHVALVAVVQRETHVRVFGATAHVADRLEVAHLSRDERGLGVTDLVHAAALPR